jgi:predicted MPP superfamily phosphohydrolase
LTAGYGVWEASQIRLRRSVVRLPQLPSAFAGKTAAVLADFHHGPYVGIGFIREAVRLANSLAPDIIALVGDFVNKGTQTGEHLAACLEALSRLRAPLGVFAVPGNHDMQDDGRMFRGLVRDTSLTDVTNRAERVLHGGQSLWLAGVDDLWWGKPDLRAALREVPESSAVVLLSHNPDFAEESPGARVGLVLSGHMHGGQIYLPALGLNYQPSRDLVDFGHGSRHP